MANSPTEIYQKCGPFYQKNPLNESNGAADLIAGHYNYGIEYAWLPKEYSENPDVDDVFRITQLREPVSRIRSLFQFKKLT